MKERLTKLLQIGNKHQKSEKIFCTERKIYIPKLYTWEMYFKSVDRYPRYLYHWPCPFSEKEIEPHTEKGV